MSTLPAPTDEKSDSSLPKEKEINSPDSPDTVALNEIEIVDKVSAELTISETTEKTEGKSVIEPNNDATNATDNAEKSSEKSGENTENTVEPKEKVPDGVAAASVTKNSVDDAKSEKTNATLPSSSVKGTTNTTSAANTNGNGVCKSVGGKAVNWIETGRATATTAVKMMRIFQGIDEESGSEFNFGLKWAKPTERDGITGRGSPVIGSKWNAVTAYAKMDATKEDLFKLLQDPSRLGEYDDMFDSFHHLVKVDENTAIRRVCCKAIWPTTARDFVVCTTWTELEDGSRIICSRFVPDEIFEKQTGYVRATMYISGYLIQEVTVLPKDDPFYEEASSNAIETPACKVTMMAHSDLGGSLPPYVMNLITTEAPLKMMKAIRNIASCEKTKTMKRTESVASVASVKA